jgi:hypothetical protein
MNQKFQPGDKVRINCIFYPEHGKMVQIVKPTGPGVMRLFGHQIPFDESYEVIVPGMMNLSNKPVIFPSDFLAARAEDMQPSALEEKILMKALGNMGEIDEKTLAGLEKQLEELDRLLGKGHPKNFPPQQKMVEPVYTRPSMSSWKEFNTMMSQLGCADLGGKIINGTKENKE